MVNGIIVLVAGYGKEVELDFEGDVVRADIAVGGAHHLSHFVGSQRLIRVVAICGAGFYFCEYERVSALGDYVDLEFEAFPVSFHDSATVCYESAACEVPPQRPVSLCFAIY